MRRLLATAAAALLVAPVVTPTMAALADPVASCSTSTGVLVVVDLRPFGGSVTRGCDATPTNGRAALGDAGFAVQDVSRQPGFVCRINRQPTTDPCYNTPPASAYWSYWHANAGKNSWTYSTQGASTYQPKNGSVDAWVFGGTDVGGTTGQPCFSPADARAGRARSCAGAPRPKPARSTKAAKPTRGRSASRPAAPATSAGRTASASASTADRPSTSNASTAAASPTTSPSTARVTTAAPSASTVPTIVDASAAAADRKDSGGGSALPVVLGLGLALVLAAGAGIATVRRRRADPGP